MLALILERIDLKCGYLPILAINELRDITIATSVF